MKILANFVEKKCDSTETKSVQGSGVIGMI